MSKRTRKLVGGTLTGFSIGVILSLFAIIDAFPFKLISYPFFGLCALLTQCSGEACMACMIYIPMLVVPAGSLAGFVVARKRMLSKESDHTGIRKVKRKK